MTSEALAPYDAVLLLSFGGPEAPDEVMPFLRRVTAGRGIPDERLQDVAHHYELFGGRSPINDQNRALIAALEAELKEREIEVPVLWGNRNSPPFLADTFRDAAARGLHRLVVVTTSAYSSYSSCRQYRENLADAFAEGADDLVLEIDKIGPYALRPAFVGPNARLVVEALRPLADVPDAELALLFVTHSIPDTMDETSGPGDGEGRLYQEQHHALARRVVDQVQRDLGRDLSPEVVYCSRSGPPTQPWLEPDVNDRLEELAAAGPPGRRPRTGRLRLRPHGGRLRPRHRGRRDRRTPRTSSWSGCPRSGSTRPSSPASSTCSRNAPRRPGERWSRPDRTSAPRCARPAAVRTCGRPVRPCAGATDDGGRARGHRPRRPRGPRHPGRRRGRPDGRRRTATPRRGVRDQVLAHRHRHDHGHPCGGPHPRPRPGGAPRRRDPRRGG